MPRKRTKTTKYGAPTVDGGFSVIKMTQLRFNDDSKSFEFEFQLEVEGVLQCFWLTWEEANTFPQYQTCFWFYIRDTITTWHANDVEDFLPSTTIEDLMEEDEEAGVPALRRVLESLPATSFPKNVIDLRLVAQLRYTKAPRR